MPPLSTPKNKNLYTILSSMPSLPCPFLKGAREVVWKEVRIWSKFGGGAEMGRRGREVGRLKPESMRRSLAEVKASAYSSILRNASLISFSFFLTHLMICFRKRGRELGRRETYGFTKTKN
jgi:hypothetical protein